MVAVLIGYFFRVDARIVVMQRKMGADAHSLRRSRQQQVYVIQRDCAPNDDDTSRLADLASQVARTLGNPPAKYFVPILRTPDHVAIQIKDSVRAIPVFRHPLIVERVERSAES